MMTAQTFLGLDLGAESGRVMAADWDGQRVQLHEVHRFPNRPVSLAGTLRWDLPRLWQELEDGLTRAAAQYPSQIAGVGVDTWGLDYVLLSKSDELLGLPFCYRDGRTHGGLEAAYRRVPRADIFAASGVQFLEINTLYQWLAHERQSPEVFAAADRFLMIPDWLNWCLCGSRVTEFTNATTTQFLHPLKRTWSTDLLERFQLPTHLLPELVEPGTALGTLRPTVSARTGLPAIPVLAPATHDTASAVVAVPTERTGHNDWAYISSGTWSLVGIESKQPLLSETALRLNVTNEGGVDGTWRVLKNVTGLWLLQCCRHAFERRGGTTDYAGLVALAEAAPAGQSWVDPDDPRFLNPPDCPAVIQAFCRETNQPVPVSEGALVRCALESLALKYAVVLDQLEQLTGQAIQVVHVVGGGSRNQLLNQLTAAACGRPVIAGPVEATAFGNGLLQIRATGGLSSLAEIRSVVRNSTELRSFVPRASEQDWWAAARARFARLLRTCV